MKAGPTVDQHQRMEGACAQTLGNRDGDEPLQPAEQQCAPPVSVDQNYLMSINVGGRRPPDNGNPSPGSYRMHAITDFMANDHRSCDGLLVAVEHAVE
jgi:hypothetical protein